MTNVPDDQAPLEPGDNELHPEIADIVTVGPPQTDQLDEKPSYVEIPLEDS